jgi:hypothetical protein
MQFYSLDDCTSGPFDAEFKEAITGKKVAVWVTGILLAGSLTAAALGYGPAILDYGLAAFAMLANAISLSMLRAARRPSNWLVRTMGDRLLIKFRSYLNDHFPASETQIVELDRSEVAWLREAKIHYVTSVGSGDPGVNPSNPEHTKLQYLEIALVRPEAGQLGELLTVEKQHPPVARRRIATRTGDAPVQVVGAQRIRVRWQGSGSGIVPDLKAALQFFSRWVEVREPFAEKLNCTPAVLAKLPLEEQTALLRQLAVVDHMGATHTMRALRGCSLTEAWQLVDAL